MLLSSVRMMEKNHIVFEQQSNLYYWALNNDNKLFVFSQVYMNILLEQFHETIGPVTFHDIVQISVLENHNEVIEILPNKLKSLIIMSTICNRLELNGEVCNNIEEISIDKSNITRFPNISNCTKLRFCRFNHSAIGEFKINYNLPPALKEINLQANLITNPKIQVASNENIPAPDTFAYAPMYSAVVVEKTLQKVNLSDNYLIYDHFPEKLRLKCNLVRQGIYKFNRVHFRNVADLNVRNFMQHQVDLNNNNNNHPLNTLENDVFSPQNVHLSSINKSVHDSVKHLIEYAKTHNIPKLTINIPENSIGDGVPYFTKAKNKWLFDIMNSLKLIELPTTPKKSMSELELFICFFQSLSEEIQYVLSVNINMLTKNSVTNLTYKTTFELIWSILCHLYRDGSAEFKLIDCFERMECEIVESAKVCFTGKYNKLLNTMVGIISGVRIGISEGEELQLEFGALFKKYLNTENKYNFSMAYCDALEILKFVDYDHTRITFMTALLDFAPDPEKFSFNGKAYFRGWDDSIFDIYGKELIGYFMEESNQIIWLSELL